MDRKTISIMKACDLVGVSRRTIYNWLSSGKVEYVRTAGGSVRIFVDTLWRDPIGPISQRLTRCGTRRDGAGPDRPLERSVAKNCSRGVRWIQSPELRLLFHRLNNQLGIILAHAELLEAKSADEMNRSRAAQVVAGALDAMGTVTEIRRRTIDPCRRPIVGEQKCNTTVKILTHRPHISSIV